MQIAEMRSALESEYSKRAKFGDQLPAMPTWCVRRIFEKRNGMSLSPLPFGIAVRSLRSMMAMAPRKSAVSVPVEPEVPQEDFDALKRRLMFLKAV